MFMSTTPTENVYGRHANSINPHNSNNHCSVYRIKRIPTKLIKWFQRAKWWHREINNTSLH